jgi:hypothetical protein
MTGETAAAETAAQPDPETAPEEQQAEPRPLVMLEADDVQACAVDGTCW